MPERRRGPPPAEGAKGPHLSRRHFLTGSGTIGVLAALDAGTLVARAETATPDSALSRPGS